MTLALRPDSPVQNPERLHERKGFVTYMTLTVFVMITLLFVDIPAMYELFNVVPHSIEPLWQL